MAQQVDGVPLGFRENVRLIETGDFGSDAAGEIICGGRARIIRATQAIEGLIAHEHRAERRLTAVSQVPDQNILRYIGVAIIGVVGNEEFAPALPQIRPVIVRHGAVGVIFIRQGDVAMAIREIMASGERHEAIIGVAIFRNAKLRSRDDPLKIAFQNKVDDSSHAVGSVNCRYCSRQHVDPIYEVGRDAVDIHCSGVGLAGDMPPPVDQHERAIGAEVAQIQFVEAGLAKATIGAVAARSLGAVSRRGQSGHALQEVRDIRVARLLNVRRVERNDRVGCLKIGSFDPRPGDDDVRCWRGVVNRRFGCQRGSSLFGASGFVGRLRESIGGV